MVKHQQKAVLGLIVCCMLPICLANVVAHATPIQTLYVAFAFTFVMLFTPRIIIIMAKLNCSLLLSVSNLCNESVCPLPNCHT